MNPENEEKKEIRSHGMLSSGGRLHISMHYKNLAQDEVMAALGNVVSGGVQAMSKSGYINGFDHEQGGRYWERQLKEKRLPFHRASDSDIDVNLWIPGYMQDESTVSLYVEEQRKAVRDAKATERRSGTIQCPHCGKHGLDFADNTTEMNGVCRSGCGFEFTVSTETE